MEKVNQISNETVPISSKIREALTGYLLLLPGITLLVIFIVAPILYGFYISLHEYDGFNPMKWIGLDSYTRIIQDPVFIKALVNTFIFAIGAVIGKNVLGLLLAMLVNKPLKGIVFFRTAFFIPVTMNVLVIGSFFTYFLNSNNGLLAEMLRSVGMEYFIVGWLSDERFALFSVIGVELWRWAGLHMLIFLAALQNIPKELYEVSYLEGASPWKRFKDITLPMIKPILFVSTLIALMGAFVRSFDLVWVLTNGGPGNASDVVLTRIYNEAFQFGRLGSASAMGFILFLIVALISFFYVKQTNGGRSDH